MKTCHERGAFAMGGMAALIPSRKDAEANKRGARTPSQADKEREAAAGFDGTWVAHPDVVATAMEASTRCSATSPTRSTSSAPTSPCRPSSCSTRPPRPGEITEEGLRGDVSVGFQYISFWLGGRGAAGINNLMEDAATAEISRSQIWQWVRHGKFTREHVAQVLDEEMQKIRDEVGDETWAEGPARRDAGDLRAGRAGRRLPRVPHPAGVRVPGLGRGQRHELLARGRGQLGGAALAGDLQDALGEPGA